MLRRYPGRYGRMTPPSLVQLTLPRGYLSGLTLSNNVSDTTNDIDIAAGKCRNSDDTEDLALASALGKRLDAAWAVGGTPGATVGWLDTGSVADGTYHAFLIKRPDTGVVDSLASLSATAPTLPTNYTKFRRVGSIIRASGSILAFVQVSNEFLLKAIVRDSFTPGTTATLGTLNGMPAGVQVQALVNFGVTHGTNGNYMLVTSPDQNDVAASSTMYTAFTNATNNFGFSAGLYRINTSRQLRFRSDSTDQAIAVYQRGWIDFL